MYNDGEESPVLKTLKTRFTDNNAVVGGTSAGAACMGSGPMITGSVRHLFILIMPLSIEMWVNCYI